MSFSTKMKATARKLISSFGDDIDIVKYSEGVYDPTIGTTPKTEVITPSKASVSFFTSNDLIEGVINMGDATATIETDLPLDKSYDIDYKGKRYNIENIDTVSTQNLNVIYRVQMRAS